MTTQTRSSNTLSLRAKLYFSFAVVVAALCAGVAAARYLSAELSENFEDITGTVIPGIQSLAKINSAALGLTEAVNTLFYSSLLPAEEHGLEQRERAEYLAARDQLRDTRERYFAIVTSRPKPSPYAEELRVILDKLDTVLVKLMSAVDQKTPRESGDEFVDELENLVPRITLLTTLAQQSELEELRSRRKKAEESIGGVVRLVAIVFLLCIGLVGALGVGLYNNLVSSILMLREAVDSVGSGKLSKRLPEFSDEEIGSVGHAFNEMVGRLEATTISRSFLESILSSIIDAVIVVDDRGRIVSANDSLYRLVGYSPEELQRVEIEQILPGFAALQPGAGADARSQTSALQLLGKSGDPVPVSLTVAPLEGQAPSWVVVARDMREQRKADSEIRLYREQLERSQQLAALGSVSALLAHKLNQPLTVIQLLLQQAMREMGQPDTVAAKLSESLTEVKFLSTTLKEVLRFTRPATAAIDEEVSLWAVADKLAAALAESAREAHMTIDISSLRALPSVRGVKDQFEEIFYILMENAVHAAPHSRPSKLTISGTVGDNRITLLFTDTGCGIAPENLERIFELFFTTKTRQMGTGLGLGIVKQLVAARGGDISVKSAVGEGTCFTVHIPV